MIQTAEIKNRRIGWTVTLLVHTLLLLFLWLYKAWPFNPPVEPMYGVQINFGTSDEGSGEIQELTNPSNSESEENNETSETAQEASSEETSQETSDINENVETTTEADVSAQKENTTTAVKVEKKTDPNETKKDVMSSKNNNGNDTDKVGDKGQKDGEINNSDIYKGVSGAGGGEGASITGWLANGKPKEYVNSNETGKVVFQIQIDEDGEVEFVKVLEKTLSPEVVLYYQRQIERISFTPKANNPNPAAHSVGTYTIIVKSK